MAKKKTTGKKKSFRILRLIFAVLFIGAAFSGGEGGIEGPIGCLIIALALLAPEIIGILMVKKHQKQTPTQKAETSVSTNTPEEFLIIPQRLQGEKVAYKYDLVSIYTPQELLEGLDLATLPLATKTELRQEPENQYDSKAVAVYKGEKKIGYLYKGAHQDMANDYIAAGLPIFSAVQSVDDEANIIKIALAFYKNRTHNGEIKSFKLVSNRNRAMQEALSISSEGDAVTYYYNVDKGRYLASTVDDIGLFPKSAEPYLEKDYDAVIGSIDTLDDGQLSVTVDILM